MPPQTDHATDGTDGAPSDQVPATGTAAVVVTTARRHRRRGWLLLAVGAFQVWLWTTRLVNLAGDPTPRTLGFVVVHALLYVAAFGAAIVLLALGWRLLREARAATAHRGDPRVPGRDGAP